MAALAPHARCQVVADAGHGVWFDQLDRCTDLVVDFLKPGRHEIQAVRLPVSVNPPSPVAVKRVHMLNPSQCCIHRLRLPQLSVTGNLAAFQCRELDS